MISKNYCLDFSGYFILDNCELLASDFDEIAINKAKSGIYSRLEIGNLPAGYMNYFHKNLL